jgi:hypothetical protein
MVPEGCGFGRKGVMMRFLNVVLLVILAYTLGVFTKQVGKGIAWIWRLLFPKKP